MRGGGGGGHCTSRQGSPDHENSSAVASVSTRKDGNWEVLAIPKEKH